MFGGVLPYCWRSCSSLEERLSLEASVKRRLGGYSRTWRRCFYGCGRESHSTEVRPSQWPVYRTCREKADKSMQSNFVCWQKTGRTDHFLLCGRLNFTGSQFTDCLTAVIWHLHTNFPYLKPINLNFHYIKLKAYKIQGFKYHYDMYFNKFACLSVHVSCLTFPPCFECATHRERNPWAVYCNFCWGPCLPESSDDCPLSRHLDSASAPPAAEQIQMSKVTAGYSVKTETATHPRKFIHSPAGVVQT